jgi:hypothetical protein
MFCLKLISKLLQPEGWSATSDALNDKFMNSLNPFIERTSGEFKSRNAIDQSGKFL